MLLIKKLFFILSILTILFYHSGCSHKSLRTMFAPTANFIVPNDAQGSIFLIEDKNNGILPENIKGHDTYYFDKNGVLRLKEIMRLNNVYIRIYRENGDEIWIRKAGYETSREYLPITRYFIGDTEEALLQNFQGDRSKTNYELLQEIGVTNLKR